MTIGSSYFCSYARTISFAIARGRFDVGHDASTAPGASEKRAPSSIALVSSGLAAETGRPSLVTEMLRVI